jgi:hypothetical protein
VPEKFPWRRYGELPPLGDGPIRVADVPEHLRAHRHHIKNMETVIEAQHDLVSTAVGKATRSVESVKRAVLIASGSLCLTLIGAVVTLVVALHGGNK